MGIPEIPPYPMPGDADLPANVVPWTIDPSRMVLLIHDMQKYFLAPFAVDKSPALDLVRNICVLRQCCSELGVPVAYTAQPGDMSHEQRGLQRDFWGPGMTAAPADRDIVDELAPRDEDRVFSKWRYSAFQRSGLLEFFRDSDRDQLALCGVYAHLGCLLTASDAFMHDIQPFLISDALADFTREHHVLALTYAVNSFAAMSSTLGALAALRAGGMSLGRHEAP